MDGLIKEFYVDKLHVLIYKTRQQMGLAASAHYLQRLEAILAGQPAARAVFAAAHSQDEFLAGLVSAKHAGFDRTEAFHMDEYIGLPADAPQRFGTFLSRAIFDRIPFRKVYLMNSDTGNGQQECIRYSELLRRAPLDIVSLGIGENGHIAFNDPHEARFDDPETVKVTTLDEPCRQQQVHDGEFTDISLVPHQAMTLTIPALMSCRCVVGIVPLDRKAKAVHDALYGPISEKCPASILRTHDDAALFLDEGAASLLRI
ncbi:6-phosphogluconolactonase [Alistipes provencensis]|uniref:6-phosphogluconolactonase n=1 Tax=Alistipes provencensis TaxID=1816676 RepID=UPI0007ED9B65|nr:6-phosphogluconolactonase [Alistipes provencensis]